MTYVLQPRLFGRGWFEVPDGNSSALALFRRHYSCRTGRPLNARLIVGPGSKLVLLTPDADALCSWRKVDYRLDDQDGVECCVFRREAGEVASDLLIDAMRLAWHRWPGERLFTFVDPLKVEPTIGAGRPTWGHCFYQAGWKFAGLSKRNGCHILTHAGCGL